MMKIVDVLAGHPALCAGRRAPQLVSGRCNRARLICRHASRRRIASRSAGICDKHVAGQPTTAGDADLSQEAEVLGVAYWCLLLHRTAISRIFDRCRYRHDGHVWIDPEPTSRL